MRTILSIVGSLALSAAVLAQEAQSEFRPVTEVPASEQLPAAPLVIAAYAFVWLAFVFYAWTMWKKVGRVEQDLAALASQLSTPRSPRGGRP